MRDDPLVDGTGPRVPVGHVLTAGGEAGQTNVVATILTERPPAVRTLPRRRGKDSLR